MSDSGEAAGAASTATNASGARGLLELRAQNFRSLRDVTLPLGPLNVLVGPNGAGKSNLIEVFRFLADIARDDLRPAIDARGGFDQIVFRGVDRREAFIEIGLAATWTDHSDPAAPDTFTIRLERTRDGVSRAERYAFTQANSHRLTITLTEGSLAIGHPNGLVEKVGVVSTSSGLSANVVLSSEAKLLDSFRRCVNGISIFDIDVAAARLAVRSQGTSTRLTGDADNLAKVLADLEASDRGTWERLVDDARVVLPQLEDIQINYPSLPNQRQASYVEVILRERGLGRSTPLADASLGTIRLLSLLALLYHPDPPVLTCIEEVDHGLHPQALELLVDRMREASERTQFIVTTHSPTLVNRLEPEEIVVCERNADGSSAIPAISTERIREIVAASEGLPLGDLWFSGTLGGDL